VPEGCELVHDGEPLPDLGHLQVAVVDGGHVDEEVAREIRIVPEERQDGAEVLPVEDGVRPVAPGGDGPRRDAREPVLDPPQDLVVR
jgi:hypothetical protein